MRPWLCVCGVLCVYVLGFLLHYPRISTVKDSSRYMRRAKMIAEGPLFNPGSRCETDLKSSSADALYPVGTSLTIAPLYRLGGLRLAFSFPLIMLVSLVLITARWIHEQGRSPCFALLILSFVPCLVLGRESMSGMPSAVLVACGMWLFWRGISGKPLNWVLSGFIAGLSVMYRETNVLLFLPLFIGSMFRRERKSVALILGGVCGLSVHVVVSLLFGDSIIHGGRSMGFSLRAVWEHAPIYLAVLLVMFPGGLVWVLSYHGQRRLEVATTTILCLVFFCAYNYSGQQSGMMKSLVLGPRFLIPLLPLLAFTSAEAIPRVWGGLLKVASSRVEPWLVLLGRTVIVVYFLGVVTLSYGIHPYLSGWAEKHVRVRDLIYANIPEDAVIVTDMEATDKYLNGLYGKYNTRKYDELEPGDLARELLVNDVIWIVILERRDSEFWIARSTDAMNFVKSLSPEPQLVLSENLGSFGRLWIWQMKRELQEGRSLECPHSGDAAMAFQSRFLRFA